MTTCQHETTSNLTAADRICREVCDECGASRELQPDGEPADDWFDGTYYETTTDGECTLTETGCQYAEKLGLLLGTDACGCVYAYRRENDETVNLDAIKPDPYLIAQGEDEWGDDVTEAAHEAACKRMEAWLTENEGPFYSVTVRPVRAGEIAGLYQGEDGGDLQILGHSCDAPKAIDDLVGLAYQHVCETWPEDDDCNHGPNCIARIRVCEHPDHAE